MVSKAVAKYLRVPPRKARLTANLIRGKEANEATSILRYVPNKGARMIGKVLQSAISNANATGKVNVDELIVKEIFINSGPIIKRFTARAQGRGTKVCKRTSHVTVVLGER